MKIFGKISEKSDFFRAKIGPDYLQQISVGRWKFTTLKTLV